MTNLVPRVPSILKLTLEPSVEECGWRIDTHGRGQCPWAGSRTQAVGVPFCKGLRHGVNRTMDVITEEAERGAEDALHGLAVSYLTLLSLRQQLRTGGAPFPHFFWFVATAPHDRMIPSSDFTTE